MIFLDAVSLAHVMLEVVTVPVVPFAIVAVQHLKSDRRENKSGKEKTGLTSSD